MRARELPLDLAPPGERADSASEVREAEVLAHAMAPLVEQWEVLAWSNKPPSHRAGVREALGAPPPPSAPNAYALWVGALVNPLPTLGVAPEIRPHLLAARSTLERIKIASRGLAISLHHLEQNAPSTEEYMTLG